MSTVTSAYVTLLSFDSDAAFPPSTALGMTAAFTRPGPVMPDTETEYEVPDPVTAASSVPGAVDPVNTTSEAVKPVTSGGTRP